MSIEWEIEELACVACGKTEDEAQQIINDSGVDDMLYEKYGCDYDAFSAIVKDLLPLTPVVTSALAETKYHAFVRGNCMIVRKESV